MAEAQSSNTLSRGMTLRSVVSTSAGLAFAAIEYPAIASLLGYTDAGLAWVSVVTAALLAVVAWVFFAELNGMYPSAATIRLFMGKALNDRVALTITFAYLSTVTLVIAADAYIVGSAITTVLHQPAWLAIFYIAALLALAAVANLRGVRVAAGLQDIAVYTVIAVTIGIAVIGLTHGETAAAHAFQVTHTGQHNFGSFVSAVLIGVFLFSAFEWVITNSEEVTKAHHVPIGMILALGMLTLTLVLTVTAMGRLLGESGVNSATPQLDLGQAAAGGVGFVVMFVITAVTAINTFNGGFITASRFMYALSREGSMPKVFSRLNGKLVPYMGVLALAGVAMPIAIAVQVFKAVDVLIEVGAVFEAMIYAFAGLCVLMLRRREPNLARTFRVPGAAALGWFGVALFSFLALDASFTVGPSFNPLPFLIALAAIYGSWWYVTKIVPGMRRKVEATPRRRPGAGGGTDAGGTTAAGPAGATAATRIDTASAIRPRLRTVPAGIGASSTNFNLEAPMYDRTDRLLAALFIAQLVAAIVLGSLLVNSLRNAGRSSSTVITGLATPVPSPSLLPSAVASAGTGGKAQTVTTTTGGSGVAGLNAAVPPGAPIKIGTIVTQTGAINFTSSAQGTKAYIDMVNAAGGVAGHKLQLELLDDQLDASRGSSEVQQLINDNVFSFVGFQAPITENTMVPTVEQAKMPVVGTYGEYQEYHSPMTYAFTADYPHYGYEMGKYLAALGSKTPALIYITNSNGPADHSLENGVRDGLAAGGVTLNSSLIFSEQPTQASYDNIVVQMRINSPQVDGMVTILDQTAYIRLQQSLNRAGFHPTHVADPLIDDPSVVNDSSVGQSVNGAYAASDFSFIDSGTPSMRQYAQAVTAAFGSQAQLNYIGLVGWFDAKAFVDALRSLGDNITRQRLIDALNSGKVDPAGYTAPWNYGGGPNLHDLDRCLQLGKLVNGKVEPAQGFNCDNETTFAN
ncbi:MAG TPA: amino acid permease [Candidatus Solibacter sp.]|nr:amino acid permease [Candidatus Solibacter sp.]